MKKLLKGHKPILCLVTAVLVAVLSVSFYVMHSWGAFKFDRDSKYISQFYSEKEDSLDGIFFGSSAAYRYWCPPQAFDRHGMAVYCYGIQSMPLFYVQHYIDSALKYQDPKFIAIELRAAAKDPDVYTTGHVLAAISRMPNSLERMKILSGFMAFDQKHKTKISKLPNRYGFPEDKGRGDNLIEKVARAGRYKGFIPNASQVTSATDSAPFAETSTPMNKYYEEDLQKLLKYCDSLECEVIFVCTPFYSSLERHSELLHAVSIVESYGYSVINMNNDETIRETQLDFATDFYNPTHTNVNGAIKVTNYLSDTFSNMYHLPDHRGSDDYLSWQESYDRFEEKYK